MDPQLAPLAMERLVQILTDIAGGSVEEGGVDLAHGVPSPTEYKLRVSQTNRLLGTHFSASDITAYLTKIEMAVRRIDEDILGVTPPSFRIDIEREADLIEEVARLYGYNEVGVSLPAVPMSFADRDRGRTLRKEIAAVLLANGCHEAINYSFVAPEHADYLGLADDDHRRQAVRLLNPLTEDQSLMRRCLLPGLLENVRRNINYQNSDVRLFETGKVFIPQSGGGQPREEMRLAVVLSGRRHGRATPLYFEQKPTDFFDAKGIATALLTELRFDEVEFVDDDGSAPYVNAAQALAMQADGQMIGQLGCFTSECLRRFGIKQSVYFVDINMDALTACARPRKGLHHCPNIRLCSGIWPLWSAMGLLPLISLQRSAIGGKNLLKM